MNWKKVPCCVLSGMGLRDGLIPRLGLNHKPDEPFNNGRSPTSPVPHISSQYSNPVVGIYVGHLESKERLRILPAQLFNFS